MRTITKEIYSFDELSEEAKQNALENWGKDLEYFWSDEVIESLKKFIEYFNGELNNYSIDLLEPHRNSFSLNIPSYMDDMPKADLKDMIDGMGAYDKKTLRGYGDCKFTGYCTDEELADGARKEFYRGETDVREIVLAGVSRWEKTVREDYEHQFTADFFADHADANGYEFTENGEMY